MKAKKLLMIWVAVIIAVSVALGLCACGNQGDDGDDGQTDYVIALDLSKSTVVNVGDTVDYTQYFIVTDYNGNGVIVTDAMIDASAADTSKPGQFTVTLTIGNSSRKLTFTVQGKDDNPGGDNPGGDNPGGDNPGGDKPGGDNPGGDKPGDDNPGGTTTADLKEVFSAYTDVSAWNFATEVTVKGPSYSYSETYQYLGYNIMYSGEDDYGPFTDYLGYDESADKYTYYFDNGDGTYDTLAEGSDDYDEFYAGMNVVYLEELGGYEFTAKDGAYYAKLPNDAGNNVLYEFDDSTWTSFVLKTDDGYITELVAKTSDSYTFTYVFTKYGSVSFKLPAADSSSGEQGEITTPTGAMERQTYDKATFDDERLQDKIVKTGEYPDPAIGLPSVGEYTALVVPVKFSDTTISSQQLEDLDTAFNGSSEATGWESVKTYYQKASYGKLDLSFDIAGYNLDGVSYYTSTKKYSYYAKLTETDDESGEKYNVGDSVLLKEVLSYYENELDLGKYDTNKDKTIDAVYLIYSAPVDYSDDSFYWAYVSWNNDTKKYDGLDSYYYLFAGLGFMNESVQGKDTQSGYDVIPGLKINAATYIHETGHLLGLDDYYDYYPGEGSDEGLGGADMMDATVGDQNVYSKIMLGWLTPEVVTSTQTITIKSSQERGDAILVPLNFDNSYFCEYLLIDLYSAQGLNAKHASVNDTYLYGGASYGVRIYHVSSWIDNAFDNDYGSFTDNNNSTSKVSLIKLVEADGETKFSGSDGYADSTDLWQKGDTLSGVFPRYTTYGGKTLIFDISIDNVSASEATITITYAA